MNGGRRGGGARSGGLVVVVAGTVRTAIRTVVLLLVVARVNANRGAPMWAASVRQAGAHESWLVDPVRNERGTTEHVAYHGHDVAAPSQPFDFNAPLPELGVGEQDQCQHRGGRQPRGPGELDGPGEQLPGGRGVAPQVAPAALHRAQHGHHRARGLTPVAFGPVGEHPHPAIAHLSVGDYRKERDRLFQLYDELAESLLIGTPFADRAEFADVLGRMIEPGLLPYYRTIGPKFVETFLGPGPHA